MVRIYIEMLEFVFRKNGFKFSIQRPKLWEKVDFNVYIGLIFHRFDITVFAYATMMQFITALLQYDQIL